MAFEPRIIDANANRAREAVRVLEDAARLVLDDAELAGRGKLLRSALTAHLEVLPPGWCISNRAVAQDVGTKLESPSEVRRSSLAACCEAASSRLGEALRVLEEVSKTIDIDLARALKDLRYQGYTFGADVIAAMGTGRAKQWNLCVLVTKSLCRRPWQDVIQAVIDSGAQAIQIRERDIGDRELLGMIQHTVEWCRPAGVSVIVNDRVDLALAGGADGVHVGQNDLSTQAIRAIAGRALFVGVSTHNLDEADAAVRDGADYVGIGAMFPSSLKPDINPSGTDYFSAFIGSYPEIPYLAIGGITVDNVAQLINVGCRGVAVSTAICKAEDPAVVAARFVGAFATTEIAAT